MSNSIVTVVALICTAGRGGPEGLPEAGDCSVQSHRGRGIWQPQVRAHGAPRELPLLRRHHPPAQGQFVTPAAAVGSPKISCLRPLSEDTNYFAEGYLRSMRILRRSCSARTVLRALSLRNPPRGNLRFSLFLLVTLSCTPKASPSSASSRVWLACLRGPCRMNNLLRFSAHVLTPCCSYSSSVLVLFFRSEVLSMHPKTSIQ